MSLNNQHAARLRAIATDLLAWDSDSADVPALFAGAEALENREELRAVVRDFQRMYCGFGMKTEAESLNERANAALARLEGK